MARKSTVQLQFPLAGVNKRMAYQSQPPFSTVDAMNVRPSDSLATDGRQRGGSRPGLTKVYNEVYQLGSGLNRRVQSLSTVHLGHDEELPATTWVAEFLHGMDLTAAPYTGDWTWGGNPAAVPEAQLHAVNWETQEKWPAGVMRDGLGVDMTARWWTSINLFCEERTTIKYHYIFGGMHTAGVSDPFRSGLVGRLGVQYLGLGASSVAFYSVLVDLWVYGAGGSIIRHAAREETLEVALTDVPHEPVGGLYLVCTPQAGAADYIIELVASRIGANEDPGQLAYRDTAAKVSTTWPVIYRPPSTGTRFGFGMNIVELTADKMSVTGFKLEYQATTAIDTASTVLVAIADGTIYKSASQLGTGTPVILPEVVTAGSGVRLAEDRPLSAIERGQLLYIADYDDNETDISGIGELTVAITDATYPTEATLTASGRNWIASAVSTGDTVVISDLEANTSVNGTYRITEVTADILTMNLAVTSGLHAPPEFAATSCSYRVMRGPKIFDPRTGVDGLSVWVARNLRGTVPINCSIVSRYNDRMVLAGSRDYPYAWFMSRQSDPFDWNYGGEGTGVAVASTASEAGAVGEPITAVIPHSDDYLIFGCIGSMWVMRGDPVYGGQFENLSARVGVVGRDAWTYGPDGVLVFLSHDGLYALAPGGGQFPQSLSREFLPLGLMGTDPTMTVNVCYDVRFRGVHIFLVSEDSSNSRFYWFDWETKSFWPESYRRNLEPTAAHYYSAASDAESMMLWGCRDGHIRRAQRGSFYDDGIAPQGGSYVTYGPVRLAPDDTLDGLLKEVVGSMALGGSPVTWEIRVGNSAEEAFNSSVVASGTWNAGRNYNAPSRVRGNAFFLTVRGASGNGPWAVESIAAVRQGAGKLRLP